LRYEKALAGEPRRHVSPLGLFCHIRQSRDCGRSVTSPLKFEFPPLACAGSRDFGSAADQVGDGAGHRLEVESSGTVTTCTQSGLQGRPLSPPSDELGALAEDSGIVQARGTLNTAKEHTKQSTLGGWKLRSRKAAQIDKPSWPSDNTTPSQLPNVPRQRPKARETRRRSPK